MALFRRIFSTNRAIFQAVRFASESTESTEDQKFKTELEKFKFKIAGYNQLGLFHDDLLDDTNADVKEAIRRLPEDIRMKRNYRAVRAVQLHLQNSILPQDQWSKLEDNHFYLQPYVDEVKAERHEREDWEKNLA